MIIFLVMAFAFMGSSNLLLVPKNGDWFNGMDSQITWKHTLANIIYPLKVVLVGPLAPIFNDPDPAPPIRVIVCAFYWTVIALVVHFLLSKIFNRKKRK